MTLSISEFEYELPQELIASQPLKNRSSARLLFVDRQTRRWEHLHFADLLQKLKPGDLLVLNNSRVIPARIFAKRESGGQVEIFLLKEFSENEWRVLLRSSRRLKIGEVLQIDGSEGKIRARVMTESSEGNAERIVHFEGENIQENLKKVGHVPLPPYIERPDTDEDRELYQTVYAQKDGSVAAPTAGLHFDHELLQDLQKSGIEIVYVTLHVNYATFKLIEVSDVTRHPMHEEEFEISEEAAQKMNQALSEKRRIIACGTTSARVLESAAKEGRVFPGKGTTRLFIYRSYDFKVIQGLITNFHLPKSTLLCLVDAFLNGEKLLEIYQEAIRERYRFFSYGDAMLIL